MRRHPIEDKNWYDTFFAPLKKSLFHLEVKPRILCGAYGIQLRSKAVVLFYHKILGLPLGIKNSVAISKTIMNAEKNIRFACIRGFGDTDFSLSFRKGGRKRHSYPVISFTSISSQLTNQVVKILADSGFSLTRCLEHRFDRRTNKTYFNHRIDLSGRSNLSKWMAIIGFRNLCHLTRYAIRRQFGFCPPNTNMLQREQILGGTLDPYELENGPEGI